MSDWDRLEDIMTTASSERRIPGNEEILEAIRKLMGTHVVEAHLNMDPEEIQAMVEEHRELYDEVAPLARDTNEKVTLLVNDMYGTPHPTAADPDAREGGWVPVLRQMQKDGVNVNRRWSPGQWTFFGAIGGSFIAACATVIAEVLKNF